jgi:hypothetical protein
MARKKIAGMSQETLLIVGAVALVGIYFLTKTTAVPVNPYGTTLVTGPGGQQVLLPGNTTAQDIAAGSQGASSLVNALSNAGIFG